MTTEQSRVSAYLGFAGVVAYLSLAVVAWAVFAGPFTPLDNWLSDLGHRQMNPNGAIYYRLAGVVGGGCLIPFFIFLPNFAGTSKPAAKPLLVLVKIFGTLAAICFVMTGIYSEDMMPMHSWFSIVNFALFGTAIALTCIINLMTRLLPLWFTIVCLFGWTADIVSWVFGNVTWLEWVVVAALITFVVSLSVIGIIKTRSS